MNKKIMAFFIFTLLTTLVLPDIKAVINESFKEDNKTYSTLKNNIITQNGMILDQDLDSNGKGYSVIHLWGSHYEMGYAQAELLGDYIVKAVNENKKHIGNNYNSFREIIANATFMPSEVEDEFNGMADCLSTTYPSSNIDKIDLKVLNTIGDWEYACRSHTCWGRYVEAPIKTLSTRRLDYPIPYSSGYHHVLCACSPDDGSPSWVSLGWPGVVLAVTGVNEYGTLVSLHDYNSYITDFSAGRMPRMVACRYALTYVNNQDISKHLDDIYNELQNYEIMTSSFLNYYAPEGYGGVMTCNPLQSTGPDFYDLRRPNENWHHGQAMITTNAWTDGTYTPPDEYFGADAYYNDETPKTLESHWDLLNTGGGIYLNAHILSVAYRNHGDMTIWAEGKLDIFGKRTKRLEWEWDDLFNLEKPSKPTIDGSTNGKKGVEYEYTFYSVDPAEDDLYYCINWGDNTEEICIGPYESGTQATAKHIWNNQGNYVIKVKAKDEKGFESEWTTLSVSMPKNKATNLIPIFQQYLEQHPIIYRLIKLLFSI